MTEALATDTTWGLRVHIVAHRPGNLTAAMEDHTRHLLVPDSRIDGCKTLDLGDRHLPCLTATDFHLDRQTFISEENREANHEASLPRWRTEEGRF